MFRLTRIPSRFLCRLTPLDVFRRFLVRDWSIAGRCNTLLLLLLLYDHLTMPAGVAQPKILSSDQQQTLTFGQIRIPLACAHSVVHSSPERKYLHEILHQPQYHILRTRTVTG